MPDKFEYEIDGKKYYQKKLVLGQIKQLKEILPEITIKSDTPGVFWSFLEEKLHKGLAVILIPEGVRLKDKDVESLAAELEFSIDPDMMMEIVSDFFDCNPIHSLLARLNGMMGEVMQMITAKLQNQVSLLMIKSSSSQAETLPGEMKSSGDSLPKSPSLT